MKLKLQMVKESKSIEKEREKDKDKEIVLNLVPPYVNFIYESLYYLSHIDTNY